MFPLRRFLLAACCAALLAAPAHAELVTCRDGSILEGVIIKQEADGTLYVYTDGGLIRVPWSNVAELDRAHPVSKTLRRKAEKAAIQLAKREQRIERARLEAAAKKAKKLIDGYARADEARRAEIRAALDAFSPAELVPACKDRLEDGSPTIRAFAIERLEQVATPEAVDALVRVALTAKGKKLFAPSHTAAAKLDASRTRRIYEAVAAAQTKPERRMRALQHLRAMNDRRAVPGVTYVLQHVLAEIQVQLATEGESRNPPPISLAGGNTSIPVELPVVRGITMKATAGIPTLRRVAAAAAATLETITGERYGQDVAAWQKWWDRQPKPKPVTKPQTSPGSGTSAGSGAGAGSGSGS